MDSSSFGTENGNNEFQQINVGSLIDTIYLYSDQCTELLKQALEREKQQQQQKQNIHPTTNKSSSSEKTNRNIDNDNNNDNDNDNDNNNNDSYSSDDDDQQQQQQTEEEEEFSSSSSSSSESEGESGGEGELIEEEEKEAGKEQEKNESSSKSSQVAAATSSSTSLMDTQKKAANKRRGNKKKKLITQTQQQRQIQNSIKKHVDNLICNSLPINDNEVIQISKSLLSTKHDVDLADRNYIPPLISEEYLKLCQSLQQSKSNNNVMIILLRSGRFAAGIFDSSNKGKCIVHRVCTHYTVRKGQGKAQSAQDNSRRPKSMGAQLRRAGEESLQNDIKETLCENWKSHLDNTCLIVLSCPKSMRKYFFDATSTTSIAKHDPRIRRLPLDLGKPTYDNVCIAYQTMMTVQIKQYTMMANANINNESTTTTKTTMASSSSSSSSPPAEKKTTNEEQPNSNNNNNEIKIFPLTPLHIACSKGDIDTISTMLLSTNEEQAYYTCQDEKGQEISMTVHDMISHKVGPYFMTCLHYAAGAGAGATASASGGGTGTLNDDNNNEDNNKDNDKNDNDNVVVDPDIAAECVTQLLLVGKADPTIVDSRDRPPIFLASHDKIKNAFRICRSKLGEEYCIDWSTKGKIGPPLTQDDIQAKKDREAEKRRAKKARQKQKKQQLKADAALEEQQKQQLEAQRIAEETAKRIRDGLQPKYVDANANICDFCQKVVKGRKRKDMFTRLDYKYCSSECVQKHKRELMASAALARFGG